MLGNAYDTQVPNTPMNSCISFIVNQDVGVGFNRDLVVNYHEQKFLLLEYSLCHYTDLSSICRTFKENHILNVTTDSGVVFTFWKSICNNSITLAFLCLPCVNNFEMIGLSTARSIKSSNRIMLLYLGSISLKSSRNVGSPSRKYVMS